MNNIEKDGIDTLSQSKSSELKKYWRSNILSILSKKNSEKWDCDKAKYMIKSGDERRLVKNLSKFEWLTEDIANSLIKMWYLETVAKNLSSFQNLSKNTANIIIKERYWCLKCNLHSFVDLDNEIAFALIENNDQIELARWISRFKNLNQEVLFSLLIHAPKFITQLIYYRDVFNERWEPNDKLLNILKYKWRNLEYEKLKEFYDAILFGIKRENFETTHHFSRWFKIDEAEEAIKYWKWKYVIEFIDKYRWSYRNLINILIKWKYAIDLKDNLHKLWWKDINRHLLVSELSMINAYNQLIENAELFEDEWISNIEIATEIIKNSDPEYRDVIKNLEDYSDDEDWEWINYNLDFYKIVKKGKKEEFTNLIEYFKSDFSPLSSNRKLPLKLKNLVKEKLWNTAIEYKYLFKK